MTRETKVAFARKAAANGMVLLKNDRSVLPLANGTTVALFGHHSYRPVRMGTGSGDMMATPPVKIHDGLKNAGVKLFAPLEKFYIEKDAEKAEEYLEYNRIWNHWSDSFGEFELPRELVADAKANADVAVLTIGRFAGEQNDLRPEKGSYYISDDEEALIKLVSTKFKKKVLLLNVAGFINLAFLDKYKFDSVVYIGVAGEATGNAVADVLTGKVNPSAKLAATFARNLDDYPTNRHFYDPVIMYREGIYVGYRYFDTFGVVPQYEFGFGLSYTKFTVKAKSVKLSRDTVTVKAEVKNTGKVAGREVVQCYISCPDGKLEKAYQELAAFAKTGEIAPGEKTEVNLEFKLSDFASFDEPTASFILEAGEYFIRVGNSSRNTHIAAAITVDETIVTVKTVNRVFLNMKKRFNLRTKTEEGVTPYTYDGEENEKASARRIKLSQRAIKTVTFKPTDIKPAKLLKVAPKDKDKTYTLEDVKAGRATIEQVVAQFSIEELAYIVNGSSKKYGLSPTNANVGSNSDKIYGAAGELWHSDKYGIPATVNADGPSGLRFSVFGTKSSEDRENARISVAFPGAMLITQSWDYDLAVEFGRCAADDMQTLDIDGWLAPGFNIQRSPLCGRNFEYCSEDPVISGICGAAITNGVQYKEDGTNSGYYATVKHFVANNSETNRLYGDCIVGEREMREILLKGFKIAIEKSNPFALMTSYNQVNGMFTSNNYDLLTGVLRGEWKYDGMVMTDWNCHGSPSRFVPAGNDLAMPGSFIAETIRALNAGSISKADAQRSACRILKLILRTTLSR